MTQPANTPAPFQVRPIETQSDRMYARASWIDEFRFSCKRFARMRAGDFRRSMVGQRITDLLESDETMLLGAFMPSGAIAGWLAYVPGRSISTVHFAYTRKAHDSIACRRRGVFASLLEAASLGQRLAYTHRGVRKKHGVGAGVFTVSDTSPSLDLAIAEWLRARGRTAVYVPIEEWMR